MSIVFLTEAGDDYGIGHMIRCESVAQALDEHWKISKFIIDAKPELTKNFTNRVHSHTKWQKNWQILRQELIAINDTERIEAIFVDSYHAEKGLLDKLAASDIPLFFMDDYCRLEYPKGYIINPEISANSKLYVPRDPRKVCAGIEYAPMRSIFWDVEYIPYEKRDGILVTLGGSGDQWCLNSILRHVSELSSETITVLTAGKSLKGDYDKNVIIISDPKGPEEMMEMIKQAKIIICGGGGTLIEAARLGTPAVVVEMADNQKNNIKAWTENGFARFAGHKTKLDLGEQTLVHVKTLRESFAWVRSSFVGIEKVDGQGARRIAAAIISEVEGIFRSVHLKRDYEIGDLYLKNYINCSPDEHKAIIRARNSDYVRLSNFNQKTITDEMHESFIRSLESSVTCGYWLVYDYENSVILGAVSVTGVDYNDSSSVLGYYKFPERVEKGVGKRLLEALKEVVFRHIKLATIFAECVESNIPSVRCLEGAGFVHIKTREQVLGNSIENVHFYALNDGTDTKLR